MRNILKLSLAASILTATILAAEDFPMDNIVVVEDKNIESVVKQAVQDQRDSIETLEKEATTLNENKPPEAIQQEIVPVSLDEETARKESMATLGELLGETADSKFGASEVNGTNIEDIVGKEALTPTLKKKLPLKNYSNIKYLKGYDWFSLHKPDKKGFLFQLDRLGISPYAAKRMVGYANTPEEIIVSALYYDYILKKPNVAENFYQKFSKVFRNQFFTPRATLADYLIRTGRFSSIKKIMRSSDCFTYRSELKNECFYYIGAGKFLETGDNRNKFLSLSKDSIKKAKQIYNKRRK